MKAGPLGDGWLHCYQPRPNPRLRLFCFPYAGGAARIYHSWGQQLPAWIEVQAVEYPAHGKRIKEASYTRLAPLVSALKVALQPHLDLPCAFFGHSLGALLAFSLCQRLAGANQPKALFLSAHPAPDTIDPEHEPIYTLPDEGFTATLRKLNGTPAELLKHQELLGLMLPVLRDDFALVETYRPQPLPPLDIPIHALGGAQDHIAPREGLQAWQAHTRAGFQLCMLPGDHFFLQEQEAALLSQISTQLERLAHPAG